jgi:hypothetical protein
LWFRDWLEAYLDGRDLDPPIYSVLLLGGTRSGKTWIAMRMLLAFLVAVPKARTWAVQEVDIERADELETELDEMIPASWATKRGGKYVFANGATITIRSGQHAHKLKRGRCDFALLNEAQNVTEAAHNMLRMRTSDTSGLVVSAANPPNDNPEGQWVADFAEECEAGRRPNAKHFHYTLDENPYINREQLEALKTETDPRTYAIEVEGKIMPATNAASPWSKISIPCRSCPGRTAPQHSSQSAVSESRLLISWAPTSSARRTWLPSSVGRLRIRPI